MPLPTLFAFDAPAHEFATDALGFTRAEWEREKDRMRSCSGLRAYLQCRRTGTRVRMTRAERRWAWNLAHAVRETPHRGTQDYHRNGGDF